MSIRRRTDPYMTQRIWDSIKFTANQKSLPTNERIVRHLARVHGITEHAAQEEVDKSLQDGLIFLKKVSTKSGFDQETYRLPTELAEKDDHDWYCCKCHKAGLVECCKQCHRVFHLDCHKPANPEQKICSFCEEINKDTYPDKDALNHILNFTCGHMKAKLPQEITNRTIKFDNSPVEMPANGFSGPTWVSEGEDAWRPEILVKNHIDLAIMDSKTSRKEYNSLAEFQADAHNILHNIIIYHGEHSIIGDMGRTMYRDCIYDLKEIRRCADCYRLSNEKAEKMWFCIPCDPPHQLVFAKQKGYPYWPSKVMNIKNDIYDVRFFGGHHLRANIEKVFIRPINVNLSSLQIKRSIAWNKSYEELKHHQVLLKKLGKDKMVSPGPAKVRKIEQKNHTMLLTPAAKKQVIKDLRVTVERLDREDNSETQSTPEKIEDKNEEDKNEDQNDGDKSSEDSQVPHLPVAEDEPTTEVSSMYPVACLKKEGSQEDMVTSSSQEPRMKCVLVQTDQNQAPSAPKNAPPPNKGKRDRNKTSEPTTSELENLKREMESEKCKELERLQAEHARELRQLTEKHQQVISEIKKKQWCYNCETEAIYHCCWNTAYCSTDCQQLHWQREHKRVCRRKR